jgi:predicted transglutaminase-like cysteine proteinase
MYSHREIWSLRQLPPSVFVSVSVAAFAAVAIAAAPANAVPPVPVPHAEVRQLDIHKVQRRRERPSISAALAARSQQSEAIDGPNDRLFDTNETQSTKMDPFTKWTGAVEKMAKEQTDVARFAARFKSWVAFLDTLKGKPVSEQLKEVNAFMNRSQYILDNRNWGVKDYWASPGEFLAKFGDCEDFSIAKYMALKYLGFSPDDLRLVAVKDMNLQVGHAILAVYAEDKIFILDNQIKMVADSRRIHHYKPVYSINEKFWWRHRSAKS